MSNLNILWISFAVLVAAILVLDLGVFNRESRAIEFREAIGLSFLWIAVALLFGSEIYFLLGRHQALQFLTGYLVEESLSVDNLFVFLIIFSYFRVPRKYQHKTLFWGIIGAMVMRAVFIFTGIALLKKFYWLLYVFGVFLLFTGIKMFSGKERKVDLEKNVVLKMFRKFFSVSDNYGTGGFFVKNAGKYIATPLVVVLLAIETTDIVFAVDSIPAIFGITYNPFIVYTSNIFAILGLRALFFALAGIMKMFRYLKYGLSVILVFIGTKMLISDFYKIPIGVALATVAAVLFISALFSVLKTEKSK